jgi:2-oxoisovalerate dehydrogenase E1 component
MAQSKRLEPQATWQEITATEEDWDSIGRTELIRLLMQMHLVRAFEEELLTLDREGLVHGPVHASVGQEGGMVAALSCLGSRDLVGGSHRGHHVFLAKALNHVQPGGYDPLSDPVPDSINDLTYRTMAEILGLSPGFCEGRGGSMHLRWDEAGMIGTNAIVGGGVPLANGAAWSLKRDGDGHVAVACFGDGSCHIGNVLESMNLAALYDLPICFLIENNHYAVSTTLEEQSRETRLSSRGLGFGISSFRVDGMDSVAVRRATEQVVGMLRDGLGPAVLELDVYRFYHHGGGMPGSAFGYRAKDEEELARRQDPIVRLETGLLERQWITDNQLETLTANVVGCVDRAADRLTQTAEGKRSIIPSLWPDVGFRDEGLRGDLSEFEGIEFVEQETYESEIKPVKFVDFLARGMVRRFETDDRYFAMGEDIHRLRGGTNGATRGLADRWSDRCVPAPIAEHGFVGLCGGVALAGSYRPIVELMYPDFALVAADQLFNQIAKARHMFGGHNAVPLVLRTKIALGQGYGSQHSMDPAGLFANWPGWRIVAPSTPFDYVGLMNSALLCEDPVLVIEHVDLYSSTGPGTADDYDYYIPLGKAKVVRPGRDMTVLTYLTMVSQAVTTAEQVGIDAEVIDLRSLDRAGLDWETIGESVRKTNHVVVLEQGPLTTSYGAIVADEVQRRLFDYLDHPVMRIHGGETSPSVSKVLERATIVGQEEIAAAFRQMQADKGVQAAATNRTSMNGEME